MYKGSAVATDHRSIIGIFSRVLNVLRTAESIRHNSWLVNRCVLSARIYYVTQHTVPSDHCHRSQRTAGNMTTQGQGGARGAATSGQQSLKGTAT